MALGIAKTFAACDHVCIQLHVPCIYNNIAMYYILCSYKNIVIVIVAINNVLCEVCELAQPMHVYKI